jgi:hypothetical protein
VASGDSFSREASGQDVAHTESSRMQGARRTYLLAITVSEFSGSSVAFSKRSTRTATATLGSLEVWSNGFFAPSRAAPLDTHRIQTNRRSLLCDAGESKKSCLAETPYVGFFRFGIRRGFRAVSSMIEHYLDTVGITGSNPVSRTSFLFISLYILPCRA